MQVNPLSDAELLAQGDTDSFGVVYTRHAEAVLKWVYRRTFDPEAAADITAETFARALVSRRRFRSDTGSARPWLIGIARHVLVAYHRKNKLEDRARRRLGMPVREVDPESYRRIEEQVDAAALRGSLADALAQIPGPAREAVRLRVICGLPYADVAERLRCSEGAARVRVFRALAQLSSLMEETP